MTRTYYIVAVLLVILTLTASLALYPRLPQSIPTHWNIRGEVDGYGDKFWALFLLPCAMALMIVVAGLLPWLSPRRFEVDVFRSTYGFLILLVVALLGYIHGIVIWTAWRGAPNTSRALIAGLFLFFALAGNVLGRVKRNFWMGVRTPWTLASERVWIDTHRLAARLFVATGLVGLATVLVGLPSWTAFALILLASVVPVVYSLVLYKRLAKKGEV